VKATRILHQKLVLKHEDSEKRKGLSMTSKRVLLVVEPPKQAMDRVFSTIKKPTLKHPDTTIISFPDFETLGRVITGARLELLGAIRIHKPKSIQELARLVRRDFKNVHQDVRLLADFGLIEFLETRPGKASAPRAKFTEIVLAA
jgi:predicted transcriptional regulator